MPTLIGSPASKALPDYAFSVANVVPSMLASGTVDATRPVESAFDPVYRDELIERVSQTVKQIEFTLERFEAARVSLADLVFMEPPDHSVYATAFEWEPVEVRIIEDSESGYLGGDDVWR